MTAPEIVFTLARGQNLFFAELAEALAFELGRLGAPTRIAGGEIPIVRKGAVNVILSPHEFAALAGIANDSPALQRCVLISAEQPESVFFGGNVPIASQAGAVLDINRRAVRGYRALGVPAEHLQLGYSEAWDRRDSAAARDIDVLFLGRASSRRDQALARYADLLERFNCEIILTDERSPNPFPSPNFLTGEAKLRLLARSKVLLNVHAYDEPYFEWLRVSEAMSSGCVVVSEHSTDPDPLRPGVDFVSGRLEALGALAAWITEDGEARAAIGGAAEEQMRARASLRQGAEALLEAAARVDAKPAGSDAVLSRRAVPVQAATDPPAFAPTPTDSQESDDQSRILRELKRSKVEILQLRRRLSLEKLARSRPGSPTPRLLEIGASPDWDAPPRPRVTVIVSLREDAEGVAETLDSAGRSTFGPVEILVVEDADAADAGERALEWIDDHPDSRCRLVRHEVDAGPSGTRNSGVALARGDMVFMLDAGDALRRHGLSRLVDALEADPGAAFAYGLLDRFADDGPAGLASRFAWEPRRLRHGNFIEAMALIRRRALLEIGGYSEDPRLALGLEEYDLWARFAEAGKHGVFVRNFVGRCRNDESAMGCAASGFFADARTAIAEHAPNLMRGGAVGQHDTSKES